MENQVVLSYRNLLLVLLEAQVTEVKHVRMTKVIMKILHVATIFILVELLLHALRTDTAYYGLRDIIFMSVFYWLT
jgi:hypothetical protein